LPGKAPASWNQPVVVNLDMAAGGSSDCCRGEVWAPMAGASLATAKGELLPLYIVSESQATDMRIYDLMLAVACSSEAEGAHESWRQAVTLHTTWMAY